MFLNLRAILSVMVTFSIL